MTAQDKQLRHTKGAKTLAALMAASLGCFASESHADSVSDFYKGRAVQMIVASGPGGGYDTYARLLLPFLQKHLPGNPTIIVQHGRLSFIGKYDEAKREMFQLVAPVAPAATLACLERTIGTDTHDEEEEDI